MRNLLVSAAGLRFTEGWEGTVTHWYRDIAGIETGGCGHVRLQGDRPGPSEPFSADAIDRWLNGDMAKCEDALGALELPFTQVEVDAWCDAMFNCGTGLLGPTTGCGKALRAGDRQQAADLLLEWCHARVKGVVQVNQGLLNRRKAERAMLLAIPHTPVIAGYQACGSASICDPDTIRELMAQGAVLLDSLSKSLDTSPEPLADEDTLPATPAAKLSSRPPPAATN